MMLIGTTFMRVATLSNLFMGTVLLPPAAAGGFLKRYDPEPLSVHIEMETAAAVARQREYTDNCGERCVNTLGWCPEGFVMLTADTKFPAYLVGGHTKYVPAGCVSASNATVKKRDDGEPMQQAVRREVVRAIGEGGTSAVFDFDAHLRRLAKTYDKERRNCLTSLQRSMYSKDNVKILMLLEEARSKGFTGPIVEEASTVAAMHHVEVQLAEGRRRALEVGNTELLTAAVAATEDTVVVTDALIESLRVLADVQANQINTLRTQVLELSSAVDVVTENGRMLQEELAKSDEDLSLCRDTAGMWGDDVEDLRIRLTAAKMKAAGVEKDLTLCHDEAREYKHEVEVCRTAKDDAASRAASLTDALSSCESVAVSRETEKNEVLESCQADSATLVQFVGSCVQMGEDVIKKAAVVAEELISCRDKAGMYDKEVEALRNAEQALASEASSLEARLLSTTSKLDTVSANLSETFLAKASADKTIMAMPAIVTCMGDDPSAQLKDTLITIVAKAYVGMSGSQRQHVDDAIALPTTVADDAGTATIQHVAKQLAAAVGVADDNTYCAMLFEKATEDETLVRHTSEWVTRHVAATLADIKDEAVAVMTLCKANAAGVQLRLLLTMASLFGALSVMLALRVYGLLKAKVEAWREWTMPDWKRCQRNLTASRDSSGSMPESAISRRNQTASRGLSDRVDRGVRTWARPW